MRWLVSSILVIGFCTVAWLLMREGADTGGREVVEGPAPGALDERARPTGRTLDGNGGIETVPFGTGEAKPDRFDLATIAALVIERPEDLPVTREPVPVRVELWTGEDRRWVESGRIGLTVSARSAFGAAVAVHRGRVTAAIEELEQRRRDGARIDAQLLEGLNETLARLTTWFEEVRGGERTPVAAAALATGPGSVSLAGGRALVPLVRGSRLFLHWVETAGTRILPPKAISRRVPPDVEEEVTFRLREPRSFTLHVVAEETGQHLTGVKIIPASESLAAMRFQGRDRRGVEKSAEPLAEGTSPLEVSLALGQVPFDLNPFARRPSIAQQRKPRSWQVSAPGRAPRMITVGTAKGRMVVALPRAATLEVHVPEVLNQHAFLDVREAPEGSSGGTMHVSMHTARAVNRFEGLPARRMKVTLQLQKSEADVSSLFTSGFLDAERGRARWLEATVVLRPGEVTVLRIPVEVAETELEKGRLAGSIAIPRSARTDFAGGEDHGPFELVPIKRPRERDLQFTSTGRSRVLRVDRVTAPGDSIQRFTIQPEDLPAGPYDLHCLSTGRARRVEVIAGEETRLELDWTETGEVVIELIDGRGDPVTGASVRLTIPGATAVGGFLPASEIAPGRFRTTVRPGPVVATWGRKEQFGTVALIVGEEPGPQRIVIPRPARVFSSLRMDGEPAQWPLNWRIEAEPIDVPSSSMRAITGGMATLSAGRWRFRVTNCAPYEIPPRELELAADAITDLVFGL